MFSGNYSSNPYLASNCVPLPEGYHVPSPRWWSVIHILLGMALPWYRYSWVSTSWYCWVEPTSCMGFSWVVQLAGWFNGVFPASIEPSSYSCRIAELCQSLVSYLVHEPGNPMVVGNGWWWLLSGDPDGFGSAWISSTNDLRSLNLHGCLLRHVVDIQGWIITLLVSQRCVPRAACCIHWLSQELSRGSTRRCSNLGTNGPTQLWRGAFSV